MVPLTLLAVLLLAALGGRQLYRRYDRERRRKRWERRRERQQQEMTEWKAVMRDHAEERERGG